MYSVSIAAIAFSTCAQAKITQIQITSRAPVFNGASFGDVGPYEQIDGTAFGEIDPNDPLNAIIQDIALAPRNARGMVEYSTDISILKPVDARKGNRTLLYETVNKLKSAKKSTIKKSYGKSTHNKKRKKR